MVNKLRLGPSEFAVASMWTRPIAFQASRRCNPRHHLRLIEWVVFVAHWALIGIWPNAAFGEHEFLFGMASGADWDLGHWLRRCWAGANALAVSDECLERGGDDQP